MGLGKGWGGVAVKHLLVTPICKHFATRAVRSAGIDSHMPDPCSPWPLRSLLHELPFVANFFFHRFDTLFLSLIWTFGKHWTEFKFNLGQASSTRPYSSALSARPRLPLQLIHKIHITFEIPSPNNFIRINAMSKVKTGQKTPPTHRHRPNISTRATGELSFHFISFISWVECVTRDWVYSLLSALAQGILDRPHS